MSLYLSKTEISSFCGDVLPLQLLGREDLREGEIRWTASSSILSLQTFRGNEPENFNNGVLLTLKKEGTATVTARFEGKTYECTVNIREEGRRKRVTRSAFLPEIFTIIPPRFTTVPSLRHGNRNFPSTI